MKRSPQQEKLEKMLQSSKFSASGFLGQDTRSLWEIIDADARELERLGVTKETLAAQMQKITDAGVAAMGDWTDFSDSLRVCVSDARGKIPCPWPHHVRCSKRITTVQCKITGKTIKWADLNIHLIQDHGFFQGTGSPYRLEPEDLVTIIF